MIQIVSFDTQGTRSSEDDIYVFIRISDTGEDISDEGLGMVFEPFFGTRPGASKRTGLGLHNARKIVEAHRGFIRP